MAVLTVLVSFSGISQTKTYVTTGGEMIFSFANIDKNGFREGPDLRWAPVFNLQSMLNRDLTSHMGVFTGIAVRNVGYIYGNYTDPSDENVYKKRFRSYNLAVPFGIKLGNLNRMFIYGGYELEVPFLYKEKTFYGGDKIDKITGWFSPRQEQFQHGFMVGIQFPYRMNLKFKYYLSEFHNREYIDGNGNRPYAGLKSHIFYFSLNSFLFRNLDFYTPDHHKNLIL
jgi:hypothetical protein